MGKPIAGAADAAGSVLAGAFTGAGQSSGIGLKGPFNLTLSGVGTVRLERSFDGGATWYPLARDVSGVLASWTVDATGFSLEGNEIEAGVLYRLNCTAYTSAITYRLSQ